MCRGCVSIKFTATCHRIPRLCLYFSRHTLCCFSRFSSLLLVLLSCRQNLFFGLGVLTPMFSPQNTYATLNPIASTWQRATFLMEPKLSEHSTNTNQANQRVEHTLSLTYLNFFLFLRVWFVTPFFCTSDCQQAASIATSSRGKSKRTPSRHLTRRCRSTLPPCEVLATSKALSFAA